MVHAWISTISIVAEVINNTAIEDMQELLQGAQDLLRQEQAASP
jgi:hypothetical protein